MGTEKLQAVPLASGHVNPFLAKRDLHICGWKIDNILVEIQSEIGGFQAQAAVPLQKDREAQSSAAAADFYRLCRSAWKRNGPATDVAARARRLALEAVVAPAKPIPLTFYALCAYGATFGSTDAKVPARRIVDWYLKDFLPENVTEVAPAHLKLLRQSTPDASAGPSRLAPNVSIADAAMPLAPKSTTSDIGPVLRSGDPVLFGLAGNGRKFLLTGEWWNDEPEFVWAYPWAGMLGFRCIDTIGKQALFECDLIVPERPFDRKEKCIISINGEPVAALTEFGRQKTQLAFPGAYLRVGANFVGFHAPRYCPMDFGSHDARELGIALADMRICFDV
jgi:hypothetical protein